MDNSSDKHLKPPVAKLPFILSPVCETQQHEVGLRLERPVTGSVCPPGPSWPKKSPKSSSRTCRARVPKKCRRSGNFEKSRQRAKNQKMCKWTRPFGGTDCRRSSESLFSVHSACLCSAGIERGDFLPILFRRFRHSFGTPG